MTHMTMQHHTPRVCIIYFSLSGQSRGLINLLAGGLRNQGVEVFIEQIVARQRIGFPFYSVVKTLKMMLLTFFRKRNTIVPLSDDCFQSYDLIILAGPTWSYNPSGPILDLLDRYGEKLFNGRLVTPLISCRGYYRLHERGLRKRLQDCGAQVLESIVVQHPVKEPWSTIGVFLRSAGYRPERIPFLAGRYPHFGHNVAQLIDLKTEGSRIAHELQKDSVALEN